MIYVMREVNGVWTELALVDPHHYKEFVGCYSLLRV